MDYNALLIDELRVKQYITPLEKDILDTWNELQKYPFNMNSAQRQVVSNNISHPKIAAIVTAMLTTEAKPRGQITEPDLRCLLTIQLFILFEKEIEEIQNGK